MAVDRQEVRQAPDAPAPQVSVVVIGRNEGERLSSCLLSVQQAAWSGISYECLYIDSNSTDQSMAVAQRLGARPYLLQDTQPNAAKARNLGLTLARGAFIMFLDGDSTLAHGFVTFALEKMLDPRRCAVTGHLREAHPEQSFFNKMIDLDWIVPVGEIYFFGGNAFVRRSCLLAVGGFDSALHAGEEPELCARLRAQGWLIELFDVPMAQHDLDMTSFTGYWRRAFRSGAGMAEVAHRMRQRGDPLWQYEARRDLLQGLFFLALPPLIVLLCLLTPWFLVLLLAAGLSILGRSASRCAWKAPGNNWLCWQYAMHSFFCKIPAVLGQLRWYCTQVKGHIAKRLNNHLLNERCMNDRCMNNQDVHQDEPRVPASQTESTNPALPCLAYLISLYPAISHTFILREVQELRRLGHEIHTASMNSMASESSMQDAAQVKEASQTFYVKAVGLWGALSALAYWSSRPLCLLKMFGFGVSLETPRGSLKGLAYAVEAAIIGKWMRENKLTYLHVHFGNAAATVGLLVKRLTGCHLSLSIHGSDEFDDVQGQHLALKVREADRLICMSQYFKAVLMRLSPPECWTKLLVCRLGVDINRFAFVVRQPEAAPLRLLCVGRLIPAKCQVLLVQACAQLRERGHDFFLTLVGAGPDQLRLEQAILTANLGAQVVMTGALNQTEVLEQFARADIFVLPSLNEGIPVVLMEAMSSGVPCISTRISGIPELIEHNHSGLLVTQGDLAALVRELERLMTQPELRQSIATHARRKVERDFNLTTNVRALSQIFQSFAAPIADGNDTPGGQ